ncbi:HAD family hydrolase [Steroidobacter sp. S1-65]|uniref:HAD family hydrolase n=1 Tax=Steroidobacter gossypii TaxID=2805490 RepID=A0ABS1X6N8_9GAMM|nr:HAD-IIIC family phosphatase [Steroidobacter gossypii]MBM0108890.1 HAD family hydrolase [Steroidobacter gossypii]
MNTGLDSLPWLVSPAEDFRRRVGELIVSSEEVRNDAWQLSQYRLNTNQLFKLGSAIQRMVEADPHVIRLGILSNGTTELLAPALCVSALRHGVWMKIITSPFNDVAHSALNPHSQINEARCNYILLCIDHRGLPFAPCPGDETQAEAEIRTALEYVDSTCEALHSVCDCTIILQTLPQVAEALFGSLDRNLQGTTQWLIDRLNAEIRRRARQPGKLLLDSAALAEAVGLHTWHDPVQWAVGKFSFSHGALPLYADWFGRLIGAALGRARKCLVLDLDNTLWGGVIGDEGLAGIQIGNGSPTGEAHLSIQRAALALRDRGILLAVSSKNDEEVARAAFRSHPDMLLREHHLSVFQANWQDKASNIEAIARELNVGLDALVLLDDNPAEREQVRRQLPRVAVPELPDDPALYVPTLLAAGYFESCAFTSEDRNRADQYVGNARRAKALKAAPSLDVYLQSLQMRAILAPFEPIARSRITQLINKTNQFNLTNRRYTELQVEEYERADSAFTLQVRLLDRFGDNGIVAVAICLKNSSAWTIDTWLMSCRVFNRKIEHCMLNHIVTCARAAGATALVGEYIPSDRNGLVEHHYPNMGFGIYAREGRLSKWKLDITTYTAMPVAIETEVKAVSSA